MKKFYLLLVALLAAVSVNAAVEKLYLIGEIVGGWNPTNGQEMTKLSDGVFYADVTIEKDVNFGFTSVLGSSDSDWDPFNGARYGADTDGLTVAVENTYNANLGWQNVWNIAPGSYRLTFDTNTPKLTVSDPSGTPDPAPNYVYEIHGTIWGNLSWDAKQMSYIGAGKWELVATVNNVSGENTGFGIRKMEGSNQTGWINAKGENAVSELNKAYSCQYDGSSNFKFALEDKAAYKFVFDENALTITVSAWDETDIEGVVSWVLRADIFSESTTMDIDFEPRGDGRLRCTREVVRNGSFIVVGKDAEGNDVVTYGDASVAKMNTPIRLSQTTIGLTFNRFIAEGEAPLGGFKNFRFVFNPETKDIMVLRLGAPMYILGTVDQDTWNFGNTSHPLTNVEGTNKYFTDCIKFEGNPGGGGYSYFFFTSTPGTEDEAKIGRYSPGDRDILITENTTSYKFVKHTNDKAFQVETDATMRIVIDLDTRESFFYRPTHLIPETMYLHGDLWKHSFDWSGHDSAQRQYSEADKTYSYEFEGMLIEDHGDGNGYFVLSDWCKGNSENPAARVAAADRSASLTAEVAANGHAYTGESSSVLLKSTYGDDALVAVTPNRYYDITLKMNDNGTVNSLEANDVTDRITTGVESVEVEDANAAIEYYNMQGVRVANPENGMYIRRKGNTVTKVFVK